MRRVEIPKSIIFDVSVTRQAKQVAQKSSLDDIPSAKILASPIRLCQVTRTRVPRDLLVALPGKDTKYVLKSKEMMEYISLNAWKKLHLTAEDVEALKRTLK